MKTSFLALIGLLILTSYAPQIGKTPFPAMPGVTLLGKAINIPADTKGKITLVGVAYSKKSDEELKTWFSPVYNTFIRKPKDPSDQLFSFSAGYDVNVYFVAMLRGVAQAASGKIEQQMHKKVDKELHPHIFLYEGAIKDYKDPLGLASKDTPYFFVLDKEGNIVHRVEGAYTVKKMDAVEELILGME